MPETQKIKRNCLLHHDIEHIQTPMALHSSLPIVSDVKNKFMIPILEYSLNSLDLYWCEYNDTLPITTNSSEILPS